MLYSNASINYWRYLIVKIAYVLFCIYSLLFLYLLGPDWLTDEGFFDYHEKVKYYLYVLEDLR